MNKFQKTVLDYQDTNIPENIRKFLRELADEYDLQQNSFITLSNEWIQNQEETEEEFIDAMKEKMYDDYNDAIAFGKWLQENEIKEFILLFWW